MHKLGENQTKDSGYRSWGRTTGCKAGKGGNKTSPGSNMKGKPGTTQGRPAPNKKG